MYYDDSSASSTESDSASSCEMRDPFYNFSKNLDRISRNACPGQPIQDAVANNPAGDLPFGNQMLLNGPSAQTQNCGYHPKFGMPVTAPENIPSVNNPPEGEQKPDTSHLFTQEFVSQNPQFAQLPSVIPELQQSDSGAADGNTNNNSSSSDEMEHRGRSPTVRRTNPLHYIVEKKVSFQQGDKLPEKQEVHCNKNNNTGNNKQKKKTKKSKKNGKK